MLDKELQHAIESHDSVFQLNWMDSVNNKARVFTTYDFVMVYAAMILGGNWDQITWEYCGDHLLIWLK